MIVVDVTVLADFLIGKPPLRKAAELLAHENPDWVSVGLWRYELGNVLLKVRRFEGVDSVLLGRKLIDTESLLQETVDSLDMEAIWRIAAVSGLTFYDASYVWLARYRGLKLRTRDGQILRACPDVAYPMPIVEELSPDG